MATLDRVYNLPAFSELRILTSSSPKEVTRVLLHMPATDDGLGGSLPAAALPRADVFGTELVPGVVVQLPLARSVAVFSPTGCTLTVSAPPAVLQRCYATTAGAVRMRSLLALHSHLEVQRTEAKASGSEMGPRVLVVGEERHVGTSTYTRMLSAFAVRLGYHPLLIDGAVDHPQFGYPGCLALYYLQHTFDVEDEATFMPGVHVFAGGERTKAHEGLYLNGVQELVDLGVERMARNDRCRVGGLFLDYGVVSAAAVEAAERNEERSRQGRGGEEGMHASSLSNPLDLLLDTIAVAEIDHVFVVQSGWLRYKLAQRAYERFASPLASQQQQQQQQQPPTGEEGAGAHLLTAPMEVVCEQQDVAFKLFLVDGLDYVSSFPPSLPRHQRWMQYFFGTPTSGVKPTLVQLNTADIRVASVGSSQQSALSTLMPMMDEGTMQTGGRGGGGGGGGGGESGEGGRRAGGRRLDAAAVNFVTTQDVDLRGRILGISSATEMELLPDGSLVRVPYAQFEQRVRESVLVGFALVESATSDKVTLLLNDASLRKDLGICLVLTDEYLMKRL